MIRPDISFHAERVDFDKMATMTDGVIIRAGQRTWVDPYADENLIESVGKLKRGVYWYWDSRSKPANQAALLAEILEGYELELRVWLDFEEDYGGAYGDWEHMVTLLQEVKRLLPQYEVGVYTGYYWWLDRVPEEAHKYFEDCPLWLAWYTDDIDNVLIPQPWDDLDMWQFTESGDGEAYGLDKYVKRAIDLNKVFGEDPLPNEEPIGDNMEDGLFAIAMELGRIADAMEGGYVPPTGGGNNEPPADDKIMHTIKPKANGSFPVYRTPTTDEKNKIRLVLVDGQQVEEKDPPKKIHKSPVWNTEADLHNLKLNWAWLPQQNVVQAANDKMVMLPKWHTQDDEIIWQGSFVERKYLA